MQEVTDLSDKRLIGCEIKPYPVITSHRKCDECGYEMRKHGYVAEKELAICPCDHCGEYTCHWLLHG